MWCDYCQRYCIFGDCKYGVKITSPDYSKPGVKETVEKDVDDIVDNSIDRGY
jgi:hypothetical protein